MQPHLSMIAAIGVNRALGNRNQLLWHIPDDLKRFKQLTMGHPIIMGRKTFESIVAVIGGPLPGRTNIVLTGDPEWQSPGAVVTHSAEAALALAREQEQEEIFIGGGAQLYETFLPKADRLYLTLIDDEKEADVFFPPYETIFTKKISEETREWQGITYRWVSLERP